MEAVLKLLNDHRLYVYIGMGLLVMVVMFKTLLNRPTKDERDHNERLQRLKDRHKDTYRNLRRPRD